MLTIVISVEKSDLLLWRKMIEIESNKLFENKQALDKKYNDSVDFYCKQDDNKTKAMS